MSRAPSSSCSGSSRRAGCERPSQNDGCAVWPRWAARCGVLSRARSYSYERSLRPCLALAHRNQTTSIILTRPLTPEELTEIQEEASLAGLGHIFPADLYPFPREAVLERWRTATDTIFADPDGLGFVAVAPPWLDALYVRPAAWGAGVADRLHEQAVEALRAAGVETARLWVLEDNRRARRFYERHGWYADGSTREVPFPPHPLDVGYSLALQAERSRSR